MAAAVVFISLRHSTLAAPAEESELTVTVGGAASPRLPRGAAVELRHRVVGVRAADRAGATVRHRVVASRAADGSAWRWPSSPFGNVLAVIPSGRLSDRTGRRPLMIIGPRGGGVSTAVVGLANSVPLFLLGAVVAVRPLGYLHPPQQAAVADIIGSKGAAARRSRRSR